MRQRKSLSRQLFSTVLLLLSVMVLGFISYQYKREKQFKIGILHTRLKDYNHQMAESLGNATNITDSTANAYIMRHPLRGLRVTLLNTQGRVLYDNGKTHYSSMSNHLERPEIRSALLNGEGFEINRHSATMNGNYFYAATYIPTQQLIVRTAIPYDFKLAEHLKADMTYIWITIALSVIIITVFWLYTRRLGKAIAQLRHFAQVVDNGGSYDTGREAAFPDNELGQISQTIVHLYKRMQQIKDEQLRMKRQLTQNISHELKTPMASIHGYLETIIENPGLSEEQRSSFLERCYAQSERMISLLGDISSLNRMDDMLHSLNMRLLDIAAIVHDIEKEVALQLDAKCMTITDTLDAPLPIMGDHSMIYSIFRNLIDNAIAYAGEGTAVVIRCRREQDFYHFTLSDNGVGIPPEHLPHIFERFYRVDEGRDRKIGGTGLGLAIVKNAVILHGGTIAAAPVAGGGVAFTFSLKAPSA